MGLRSHGISILIHKGFILLPTLIMLQLVSVLSLHYLQSNWWVVKATRDYQQREKLQRQILTELTRIEQSILQRNLTCGIETISSAKLKHQSMTWWRIHGCSGNLPGIRYYYAIEFLGHNECAIVQITGNTVDYYRVTLLAKANSMRAASLIFQSTLIKPSDKPNKCSTQPHYVSEGRQAWREL